MWIRERTIQLKQKHQTSCPYKIAENLKIHVLQHDLHHEINGYYKYDRRNQFIVINDNLDENLQRVVCAHELGHAILHKHVNTPFMRSNTFFSVSKIEREANQFAAELLIPDEIDYEVESVHHLSSIHNVPIEIAKLKYLCREVLL
ncbi:ImmA/IrrE family metallo-endopeptidase [Solibacillus sp. FSL R7-0682]|uniref:ImmA/IrrE family metallo-endopeptidase n=1 Tax=Solibacillus sp. FSL R7-0682 TaxID=2921690 RepID=UPI0030FB6333